MLAQPHKYAPTSLYICVSLNVYSPFDQDVSLPNVTAGVRARVCVCVCGGVGLYCRPGDQRNQCVFKGERKKPHVLQRGVAHCNDVDSSLIRVYTPDSTRGRPALVHAFFQGARARSDVKGSCGEIHSATADCLNSVASL